LDVEGYYLNISQDHIDICDETDFVHLEFTNTVVHELFRAELSPTTMLRRYFISNVQTFDYDRELERRRMIEERSEATPLLEAQLPEYCRDSLDEICNNDFHSGEKSSGNARVQGDADRGQKASDSGVDYPRSASVDTAQRYDNSGDSYSKHSVSNNPNGDIQDQDIKEDAALVAGTLERSPWLGPENNNSNHANDDKAYSSKESATHNDSDPVEDSRDELADTSIQYGKIRRRHSSKLIRDLDGSDKPNHNNCKLTIWHVLARSTCFENHKNDLREDEPSPALWTLRRFRHKVMRI
jgi:hypothetical protein